MSIERILMPTDFSECAEAALDRALALAKEHGAELHVLHVVELHALEMVGIGHGFPALEEVHSRLEALARTELGERLKAKGETSVLVIEEAIRRGVAPAPTVSEYAREYGIDLIVIGTHGRRGLRRWLLGSVTEELVRTAPCPVLTIPGTQSADAADSGFSAFDHMVVAFDFSTDSDHALDVARAMIGDDGRIDVVHVIPPPIHPEMYAPLAGVSPALDVGALRGEVERRLVDAIARVTGPDVTVAPHVVEGHPASALTEFADHSEADLIVLGSRGLTGLPHLLLGSVSAGVIRAAAIPVLIVRDDDAAGTR